MTITLEICVDSADGLAAAIAGGADRIELCSALALGGLTPSPGLMALAARAPIPVYAMIRPRDGDFVVSPGDLNQMRRDIDAARAAGLAGVVFGASEPRGALDVAALRHLAHHAAGLGRTLHRAFDLVPDRSEALETAIDLGFERILTSGGAPQASEALGALAGLVADAGERISIMPGAGVRPDNAALLLSRTGAREIHASCRTAGPPPLEGATRLGFAATTGRGETSAALVAALVRAIQNS